MKASVFSVDGKPISSIELPIQFTEEYRPDLILRAVKAINANSRQPYGAFITAGRRQSAKLSRRRRDFKTAYGHGISRVPRKSLWRRGTRFGWVGAVAPGTVGGRRAHPPKAHKNFAQKINVKERRKAIRSALAATTNLDLVKARGHLVEHAPLIIENAFEKINRTQQVEDILTKMNLGPELARVAVKKVRAGKGKNRNRRRKMKAGPLIVTSGGCNASRAAANITGIEICPVNQLNAAVLAPGGQSARMVIYTEGAIKTLHDKHLFCEDMPQKEARKKP